MFVFADSIRKEATHNDDETDITDEKIVFYTNETNESKIKENITEEDSTNNNSVSIFKKIFSISKVIQTLSTEKKRGWYDHKKSMEFIIANQQVRV